MPHFLTQQEIDILLGIACDDDVIYPIFLYLKKPNGDYAILEITKQIAEKLLGSVPVYEEDIYKTLEKMGNKIIISDTSKKRLTAEIHKRYNDLVDAEKELRVLKKYLSEFPEYML